MRHFVPTKANETLVKARGCAWNDDVGFKVGCPIDLEAHSRQQTMKSSITQLIVLFINGFFWRVLEFGGPRDLTLVHQCKTTE